MKNAILKVMLTAIFMAVSVGVDGQVKVSAEAGYGLSTIVGYPGGQGRASYRLGVGAVLPLSKHWKLSSKLRYAIKGDRMDGYYGSEQIGEAELKTTLRYLELPVYIGYRFRLGNHCGLILKTGPYLAVGLNGRHKITMKNTDYSQTFPGSAFSDDYNFYGDMEDDNGDAVHIPKLKRFELGWTSGIDFEVNRFTLGFDMQCALTPLANDSFSDNKVASALFAIFLGGTRNVSLGFNVGYDL